MGKVLGLAVAATFLLIGAVAESTANAMAAEQGSGAMFDYKPGTVFRDCPDCPEMVVIPAGSFIMGAKASELGNGFHDESPQHRVTIRRPFAVGKYVVTEEDWQSAVAGKPGVFKGSHKPVRDVSWNEAQEVIRRLNEKVRSVVSGSKAGDGPYRLLTEAEWEYAARAGTTTRYSWGNSDCISAERCDECGSFLEGKEPVPERDFLPNPFGLYSMHGYIWQWVQDCYVDNYSSAPIDGRAVNGPKSCIRVLRGGSCYNYTNEGRSAYRTMSEPDFKDVYFGTVGFRLARTLP
jgi:formylglycine-generating enzyme required for sulfatase activity